MLYLAATLEYVHSTVHRWRNATYITALAGPGIARALWLSHLRPVQINHLCEPLIALDPLPSEEQLFVLLGSSFSPTQYSSRHSIRRGTAFVHEICSCTLYSYNKNWISTGFCWNFRQVSQALP